MDVYVTFGDLPSWLAIAPLKRLMADTGTPISWRPLLGNLGNVAGTNRNPGEEDPLADYKARRAAARKRAKTRELERMCETLGLSLEQGQQQIDPGWLSLGLLWARESATPAQQLMFIELAFERTFRDEADVTSEAGVAMVLKESDIATAGFSEFASKEKLSLEAGREALLQQSILNAPAFVIDGEVFNGREHLPLIDWMLSGRHGTPPS